MRVLSTGSLGLAMAVGFVATAFACGGGTPSVVTVTVDVASEPRRISPLIYGVSASGGGTTDLADMGVSVVRWGGNARSRHNWEINASNAGADWEFRNVSQGDATPGSAALGFFASNRAIGAESILSIPMVGWVAGDGDSDTRSLDVPIADSVEAIDGYSAADNRQRTSLVSMASKNGALRFPPNLGDGIVYQDEWVAHLVQQLGTASGGGIRFYEMDNEPTQWWATHTDVAPASLSYSGYLETFLAHSAAVRRVDESAQILGPSVWGWSAYFSTAPNGDEDDSGLPFIPRLLTDIQIRDAANGTRSLDALSVHYYPQGGVVSDDASPDMRDLRIRSTRSLWDPIYRDESWIADTPRGPTVRLIPRLRAWIDRYYPGTGLAITEWNWGAEHDITGGLAVAEVLGVYGREGVDIATHWGRPALGSPVYWAFRMFRNYDGDGGAFGDWSLASESSHPDYVSSFASVATDGRLHLMLLNKDGTREIDVRIELAGTILDASFTGWRYDVQTEGIAQIPVASPEQRVLRQTLPPYSITLLIGDAEAD